MQDELKKVIKKLKEGSDWAWVLAGVVLFLAIGLFSVQDIEPGEVAVKVNNLTGAQTAITKPGWTIRLPFLQSVYVLDSKPHTFSMKGTKNRDSLNVGELTVRASDGSNFHFTDTTIIFELKGDEAVEAVRDAGLNNGYMQWMKPYARSILRDEFGRESTINVSNPASYGQAANRAKKALNDHLSKHAIFIRQLVTPRPRFNKAYEKAIEDRNALSNQLAVISSNLQRAETNRARVLAVVNQKKNKIIQQRRATLESDLAKAAAEQANVKRQVDTYRIAKIAEGQAALSGSKQKAIELQGELVAVYAAKKAEISAFRNQPVERVMEKIGEKLKGVTINIQPWADDATPSRIRYETRPVRKGGAK